LHEITIPCGLFVAADLWGNILIFTFVLKIATVNLNAQIKFNVDSLIAAKWSVKARIRVSITIELT
jgi:hypothetical protein